VPKSIGPLSQLTKPMRSMSRRFTYFILVIATFALLMIGRANVGFVEDVRTVLSDAMTPILELFALPGEAVSGSIAYVGEVSRVHEENQKLRKRVEELARWELAAKTLEAENKELQKLLNFAPEQAISHRAARVIADQGGSFMRSAIVNAGKEQGVTRDQAVISTFGLAGRVVEVGRHSARLLLVTDFNSRIPVLIESSRWRAVMAGDNTERPKLLYLSENATVTPGERIITSGHGGMFPPGLPVGIVDSVSSVGVRIRLYDDFSRLEFVRLIDFGLRNVLHVDRLEMVENEQDLDDKPQGLAEKKPSTAQ